MILLLTALATLPIAQAGETVAMTPDRVAFATSHGEVQVYGLPHGALIASIPFDADGLEWLGDGLVLQSSSAFAWWSESAGLHVAAAPRAGRNAWVGPDGLLYAWGSDVRVVDPWTGLSQTLWTGEVDSAATDGFVDAQGLHGWDGTLLAPTPEGLVRECQARPGPSMVCMDDRSVTRVGKDGSTTWRSPEGATVVAALSEGPDAGTLLVRTNGADSQLRLLSPTGQVAGSWPHDDGEWSLSAAGLVHHAEEAIVVYGLDGVERARIPALADSWPTLAIPEPALLVRQRGRATLLAMDDGSVLAQAGELPAEVSVREGVATFTRPRGAARFRAFNESAWVFEADGASTTATIRRPGVQGEICGDTLGLVTTDGALEAYTQKGVKRWGLAAGGLSGTPAGSVPRLVSCDHDAWVVGGDDVWALVEAAHGKVLARGKGEPALALLPAGVAVEKTGAVTMRSGTTFSMGPGWKVQGALPATRTLPEGVLATRSGYHARIDGTGIRWEVRLGNGPVVADGDRVYTADDGVVVALDAGTGTLVWASPLGINPDAAPLGISPAKSISPLR